MKKIFMLMASAAIVFAASCNKIEEVNTPEPVVETELITVDLNPMTKTSLNGKATKWSAGDAVSVTVGGENIGTLTLVEGSTFSGEVKAGRNGDATLNYPAGVTSVPASQAAVENSFANGAALLEGKTTMAALRAGEGAQLSNTTALLGFTPAVAGDVAFMLGNATYTVTDCEATKVYYVCVSPTENAALSYTIAGAPGTKSKSSVTFMAGLIYQLNELQVLASSGWSLPGGHNNWTVGKNLLYEEGDYYVAKNIDIKSNEFKFNHAEFGWKGVGATAAVSLGEWHKLNGENNITLASNTGKCDVYMTKDGSKFQAVAAGSPVPEAPVVVADYWGLIGSMTSWAEDLVLVEEGDYLVYKGVQLETTDQFKFRKNGEWAEQKIASATAKADIEYDLVDAGSNNMKVAAAGTYDVYVKKDLTKVYFMTSGKTPAEAGKATTYKLYIKNTKNWSNLYLYAWGGYATGSWPGTKLTKQEQAPDSKGQCYYIEIPLGTNIVNFIVNNGSGSQTADLKASNLTKLSTNDYFYELK